MISKKKIVKLNGGLGNQMFQYAFACALAKKFDIGVTLDDSWFEDVKQHKNVTIRDFILHAFNLDYEIATKEDLAQVLPYKHRTKLQKFLWRFLKIKKYKPDTNYFIGKNAFSFDRNLFTSDDYFYYEGYFQNEKYFKHLRENFLSGFTLNTPLDEENQSVLNQIFKTNSVSIHIRRGDYITNPDVYKIQGACCPGDYYKKAIKYIVKHVENPHFFVFSDDIQWVKENFKIDYPMTIVDFNQNKSWFDLNLMRNCKHNIIANSSFSWWGAWLNKNPNKIVVTPKKWVLMKQRCSLILKEWVRL